MIKRVLAVIAVTATVAGCALFPSQFDNQEHARLVNVHVASKDNSVCSRPDDARVVAELMYRESEWVWHYGQTLPDNSKMVAMESNLLEITRELRDRYQRPDPVSAFYCRSKFENIHRATSTMIAVSARRPR